MTVVTINVFILYLVHFCSIYLNERSVAAAGVGVARWLLWDRDLLPGGHKEGANENLKSRAAR